MQILRLLNKKFIIFFFLFFTAAVSNEPVDIWNIDKKDNKNKNNFDGTLKKKDKKNSISTDIKNETVISITEENNLNLDKNYLVGIYDPSDNDLSINMWELSDGEKITKIIKKIKKLNLSEDAKEIYNYVILTNSFPPKKNFSKEEFLKIKIDWLIKNGDLELIKDFVIKNKKEKIDTRLLKYYLDQNLSMADLENACKLFSFLEGFSDDDYVFKYKIYCLINEKKNELAQLQFDLIKEDGFKDIFFEEKFSFIMGYSEKNDLKTSEKNLLDFHLSHLTSNDFKYVTNENTDKIIWRYLSSFNLLENLDEIDIEDSEKIISIEKATNNGNYLEKDLLNLYTRYRFSINQLITVLESYKMLPGHESRALLYQGFLISKDVKSKIELIKILKEQFNKDDIGNAFNNELVRILEELDEKEIPSNYSDFYNYHLADKKNSNKKIKFNNKIIHQSKLLNYFSDDIDSEKIEKELEKKLKKIKKNKKYYFSTKDIILIESLISDGIKISDKYSSMLELYNSNIPTDIEVMINDGEMAMILLRLVEIIGEDDLNNLGSESLYFILSTLNKLNIDKIRNNIILKTFPLKV
ncbi:MAG: hypothetical protein ACJZ4I_02430 [Candidatus Pelagibacter sp.]